MTANPIAVVSAGAIFGAALTASGVYLPEIIISQMELRQFHMLKTFLTASASSALILAIFSRLGLQLKPRPASNLGWIGPYDGNIIGGAMIGAGMTLTGGCPGTVFVQIATGIQSAIPTFIGGLLGGILYTKVSKQLRAKGARQVQVDPEKLTVPKLLKVDPDIILLAFEALCIIAVTVANELASSAPNLLNPIIGGLCIGGAQLASVILTKQAVGISGAFEEFGSWVWRILDNGSSSSKDAPLPPTRAMYFAGGVAAGAYAFARVLPQHVFADKMIISPIRGILGGIVMIFGARLAGGCTSGHGISGMSLMSVSSVYSVLAMFGGGIGLAALSAALKH